MHQNDVPADAAAIAIAARAIAKCRGITISEARKIVTAALRAMTKAAKAAKPQTDFRRVHATWVQ